jgi:hypothetical protein
LVLVLLVDCGLEVQLPQKEGTMVVLLLLDQYQEL